VVQQKQGRVKPTLQLKGVAINDDSGLEREAHRMGAQARHAGSPKAASGRPADSAEVSDAARLGDGSHQVTTAQAGRPAGSVKLHDLGRGITQRAETSKEEQQARKRLEDAKITDKSKAQNFLKQTNHPKRLREQVRDAWNYLHADDKLKEVEAAPAGRLQPDAITTTKLNPTQKEEIINSLKTLRGKTGDGKAHDGGEGVGGWKATGIKIEQTLYFDIERLAWTGTIHYDFTGSPHGSVPTPHVQLSFLRAAGSERQSNPNLIRELELDEINALLRAPAECPGSVWDWVLAWALSSNRGDSKDRSDNERKHIFRRLDAPET
jgi:hypothetical protein